MNNNQESEKEEMANPKILIIRDILFPDRDHRKQSTDIAEIVKEVKLLKYADRLSQNTSELIQSTKRIKELYAENESLKKELAKAKEPGATMHDTRGNSFHLMFICQACCRRAIYTNRIDGQIMRCSTCSHNEFEIEVVKRDSPVEALEEGK